MCIVVVKNEKNAMSDKGEICVYSNVNRKNAQSN